MGIGVYLASLPMTSLGYCVGGTRMFACKVILGSITPTAMFHLPQKADQNTYDSYGMGGIFVVRDARLVLPQYVVEFGGSPLINFR